MVDQSSGFGGWMDGKPGLKNQSQKTRKSDFSRKIKITLPKEIIQKYREKFSRESAA